jgi:hypothetical protein
LCNFLKNQQEEEIQRKFRGFLWMVWKIKNKTI